LTSTSFKWKNIYI